MSRNSNTYSHFYWLKPTYKLNHSINCLLVNSIWLINYSFPRYLYMLYVNIYEKIKLPNVWLTEFGLLHFD